MSSARGTAEGWHRSPRCARKHSPLLRLHPLLSSPSSFKVSFFFLFLDNDDDDDDDDDRSFPGRSRESLKYAPRLDIALSLSLSFFLSSRVLSSPPYIRLPLSPASFSHLRSSSRPTRLP
ncbi:hypothetical protein PUN28_002909 [Cardiocondyla obscurior]|uniref:Uncharacterized protein n=1 Tax=Cardiocondyla obscurior TaxID=286306 RepID=A0AAW2GWN8_9HYME